MQSEPNQKAPSVKVDATLDDSDPDHSKIPKSAKKGKKGKKVTESDGPPPKSEFLEVPTN